MKHMLEGNTGPAGDLDTDWFQRVMLTYWNMWDPNTSSSPALAMFSREIRDFIPIPSGHYWPAETWSDLHSNREQALQNSHQRECEKLVEHTKHLVLLIIGDHVHVQNQLGNNPGKWDNTGTIVEVKQFDQYFVKIDGSGRLTMWNRRFLHKFQPFQTPLPM
jgi:hypothetical protein